MKDIAFKQVLDTEGNFTHLELIQDTNIIRIKFGNSFAQGNHTFVWEVLKETIDTIADRIAKDAGAKLDG